MIPQLMPLMWINSVGICFLIVLMLINLYNLKEEFNLMKIEDSGYSHMISLKW